MTEENIHYKIIIKAGPKSEIPGQPFAYNASDIPEEVRTVDERPYKDFVNMALQAAKSEVLRTNRNLTLSLEVKVKPIKHYPPHHNNS